MTTATQFRFRLHFHSKSSFQTVVVRSFDDRVRKTLASFTILLIFHDFHVFFAIFRVRCVPYLVTFCIKNHHLDCRMVAIHGWIINKWNFSLFYHTSLQQHNRVVWLIHRNGKWITTSNNAKIHQINLKFACRYSTNIYTPPVPVALTGTAVAKDESREFMAVFPDIVRDLTDAGRHSDIPDVTKWYAKVGYLKKVISNSSNLSSADFFRSY